MCFTPRDRHRRMMIEDLEARSLHAVDLSVEIGPASASGDVVTTTIGVFNRGVDTAEDARVFSDLSSVLDDPTWTRRATYLPIIDGNQLVQREIPLERTQGDRLVEFDVPVPAGDINNDGFADAAVIRSALGEVEIRVFLGDAESDVLQVAPDTASDANGFAINTFGDQTSLALNAIETRFRILAGSDINGDGIDDLIISTEGEHHKNGTQCDYQHVTVRGGAFVVLGDSELGAVDTFVPTAGNHVAFSLVVPYFDARPRVSVGDVDGDSTVDMMISGGGRTYMVFGGPQIASRDFGNSLSGPYEEFDGTDGFAIDGPFRSFLTCFGDVSSEGNPWFQLTDANGDGIGDFAKFHQVRWSNRGLAETVVPFFSVSAEPVAGTGNLHDVVDVPPGTGFIYSITGIQRPDQTDLVATVVPGNDDLDRNLRNNIAPQSEAVWLDVELADSVSQLIPGETATVSFTVTNHGPNDLASASLTETFSSLFVDHSWTKDEDFFPDVIDLSLLDGGLGVQRQPLGPLTPWGLPEVVQILGAAGDVNGDGFDDILLQSGHGDSEAMPRNPLKRELVFGGEDFGTDGKLGSSNGSIEVPGRGPSRVIPLGDINADGFDDFALRYSVRPLIVLGRSSFENLGPLEATSLAFVQSDGFGDGQFFGVRVDANGEFNGDGVDDLLFVELGRDLDDRETAFAHLIFGGEHIVDEITLDHLDGTTGIRVQVGNRTQFVGDVNDDGFDDIRFDDFVLLGGNQRFDSRDIDLSALGEDRVMRIEDVDLPATGVGFGDVNGDGVLDSVTTGETSIVTLGSAGPGDADEFRLNNGWQRVAPTNEWISDFDVNGDGADDFFIYDETYAGDFGLPAFLVFGRVEQGEAGVDRVASDIAIPAGGSIHYTVTGTVRANPSDLVRTITVTSTSSATQLDPSASSVSISFPLKAELPGDIDGNGEVAFADFLILSQNIGRIEPSHMPSDLDDDGEVGFSDFLVLSANFGRKWV